MTYNCSEEILDGSICWHCKYRVSRTISTEGLELRDEDDNTLDADDLPVIELEFCRLLHTELDVIVLECSAYGPAGDNADDFFTHKDVFDV